MHHHLQALGSGSLVHPTGQRTFSDQPDGVRQPLPNRNSFAPLVLGLPLAVIEHLLRRFQCLQHCSTHFRVEPCLEHHHAVFIGVGL